MPRPSPDAAVMQSDQLQPAQPNRNTHSSSYCSPNCCSMHTMAWSDSTSPCKLQKCTKPLQQPHTLSTKHATNHVPSIPTVCLPEALVSHASDSSHTSGQQGEWNDLTAHNDASTAAHSQPAAKHLPMVLQGRARLSSSLLGCQPPLLPAYADVAILM